MTSPLFYEDFSRDENEKVRQVIERVVEQRWFQPLAHCLRKLTKYVYPDLAEMFKTVHEFDELHSNERWQDAFDLALAKCRQHEFKNEFSPMQYEGAIVEASSVACVLLSKGAYARLLLEFRRDVLGFEGYLSSRANMMVADLADRMGERNDAAHFLKRALAADPTWAEPSILAARLGVRGYCFDATRYLRDAIAIDSSREDELLSDDDFLHL